jgi:hypothetical protein
MEIDTLKEENQYLKEKLDYLIRQKYTSKSEKFVNQPSLFGDEEEIVIEEDTEVVEITRKKGGRKKRKPKVNPTNPTLRNLS